MWISSYCVACIYHTTVRLFSLLTYEDGNSPAMKHIKHISGVNKLVEAIHIIQNKQQCQTTEYDIQFICCSYKNYWKWKEKYGEKHRKKHVYDSKELIAKNRFVEEIQKRYSTLDPTQKIIVQTQTKLPTFRWYREEKITPQMQRKNKPINGCHKELLQKCRKIWMNGYFIA